MPDHTEQSLPPLPTDEQLCALREAAGPVAFAPGFVDRVMARRQRTLASVHAMRTVFLWMAPTAAAAALILAVVNLTTTRDADAPLVDRLLGLPSVTLATAYMFENDLATWGARTP